MDVELIVIFLSFLHWFRLLSFQLSRKFFQNYSQIASNSLLIQSIFALKIDFTKSVDEPKLWASAPDPHYSDPQQRLPPWIATWIETQRTTASAATDAPSHLYCQVQPTNLCQLSKSNRSLSRPVRGPKRSKQPVLATRELELEQQ